jgi:hypothetical protein
MIGKLKKKIHGNREGRNDSVHVEKKNTLQERIDDTMQAVTFAEAGMLDAAVETMAKSVAERRKILVVAQGDAFSRAVMDYSTGFADRMGYDIVALNVLPLATRSPKTNPYCTMVSDEFEKRCERSVMEFKQTCDDQGIAFSHICRTGDPQDCLKQAHEELRRVEFVVSDPVDASHEGEVAGDIVIPVFSMAH